MRTPRDSVESNLSFYSSREVPTSGR